MSYTGSVPSYRFMLSATELDLLSRVLTRVLQGGEQTFTDVERNALEAVVHEFARAWEADTIFPVCPVHYEVMVPVTGPQQGWWRCKEKNGDDHSCTYRRYIKP